MRHLLFSLVVVLSQVAYGQGLPSYQYDDYDFEKYQRIYEQQNRVLIEREAELQRRQEALRNSTNRYVEVKNRLDGQQNRLADLKKRESDYPKIIQDLDEKIRNRTSLLNGAEDKLKVKDQQIVQNQNEQKIAQTKIADAKKAVGEVENRIKEIKALPDSPEKDQKLADAKKDLAAVEGLLQVSQKELQGLVSAAQMLNRERQQLNAEIERAKREIADDTKRLAGYRTELAQIKTDIPKVQDEIRNLSPIERNLAREVELRTNERDDMQRFVHGQRQAMNQTALRMERINQNIAKAGEAIAAVAEAKAEVDGRREGRELGKFRGEAKGRETGEIKGRDEGIKAGQDRDWAAGRKIGQDSAEAEATKKATDEAEAEGKSEGLALGRSQGLEAAYRTGRARGEAAANDSAAHAIGRSKGDKQARADAINNGAYREGEGFEERKAHYHRQPLKPIVIGNKVLTTGFNGIQGRFSVPGDDRYYEPRPGSYPHPRLMEYYTKTYDAVYKRELEETYEVVYETARSTAYELARQTKKAEYEAKDYPESRKAGRDYGWNETYRPVFESVKGREKPIRKEKYRQQAFDANKNDQGQIDKGYREGNAFASENKGYAEKYAEVYETYLQQEKDKAHKAGIKRADDLYMKNAVLEMVELALLEEDQDGIFRPGEGILAQIKLKNWGLVGKQGLSSVVANAKGIQITQPQVLLAEIPAQSDVTVFVNIQGQIAHAAKEGEALALQVNLKNGLETLLSKNFNKVAQFPAKIVIAGFDGILIPGVATSVKIVVTNRSKKTQNLDIALALDNARVSSDKLGLEIANLGAGKSSEQVVTLTGNPDAQFEESPLSLTTNQGAQVFAAEVGLNMTIIKKHLPTNDSKGLILSNNLAQGGGKAMFASDKLDTWDLRVDGALKSTSLDAYLNKVVHIMADAKSNLDAASLGVVTQFIQAKKGTVILWGSKAHESGIAKQLAALVGAANLTGSYVNESLKGSGVLNGLVVSYNGNATLMNAADSLSQAVLSRTAVSRIVDGTADRMGLALLVGLEPSVLTATDLTQISAYTKMHNMSFEQKMEASKKDASYVHLVIAEILAELRQAEINRSERYYRDKGKSSKIGKALNKYLRELGEKAGPTQEFVRQYPNVANYINAMKNTVESFQADGVMNGTRTSGFLGKTWKDLWCNKNSNDKLCRQDWN